MGTWLCCCPGRRLDEGGLDGGGGLAGKAALEEERVGDPGRSMPTGVEGRLMGLPSGGAAAGTLPSGSAIKLNTRAHVFIIIL
jgi:hypothetical protein